MPDVEKILKMVEQGALTAEEADQILATLSSDRAQAADNSAGVGSANRSSARDDGPDKPHHLRVEITEGGERPVSTVFRIGTSNWTIRTQVENLTYIDARIDKSISSCPDVRNDQVISLG